jgi:glyoxalase family protein
MKPIQGLHHITAVAGDPQANLDFYHRLLGQRLVKKTVNFDDPGTYHFYFGDETGTPGTILTFFPWAHMKRGVTGNGETTAVAYTIRPDAIAYWRERLSDAGVMVGETETRFGHEVIAFHDPDGMRIEFVANDLSATINHWAAGPVPADYALRGFHSVTLQLGAVEPTADLLTGHMGYTFVGQEGQRYRYAGASGDVGLYVDILHRPDTAPGRFGAGSIHHIAFRTVDDAEQVEYQEALRRVGFGVTPVRDRQYFHSIYFRSPGGVLFEVATDAPGFLYDEPVEMLGRELRLPPWLEAHRPDIEAALPVIYLPESLEVG